MTSACVYFEETVLHNTLHTEGYFSAVTFFLLYTFFFQQNIQTALVFAFIYSTLPVRHWRVNTGEELGEVSTIQAWELERNLKPAWSKWDKCLEGCEKSNPSLSWIRTEATWIPAKRHTSPQRGGETSTTLHIYSWNTFVVFIGFSY